MFELSDTTLRSAIAAERVERLAGETAVGGGGTGLRRRLGSLIARVGRERPEQEPECIAPAPLPFRG